MTRKQLAKKLNIPSYNIDEMFWDMVEVDKLLEIINKVVKESCNLQNISGSTQETYEEETRNDYYCNVCGALEEFDCCCEEEDSDREEDEDDSLIRAASCRCGACRIKDNKVVHVADCVCGAD